MDDYKVGYGKPPEATRFAKGKSGNPSGRKKGKINVVAIFHDVMQATISVTENGRTRSMTKYQAVLMRMVSKAVSGDLGAMKLTLQWSHILSQTPEQNPGEGPDLEKNMAVLKQFLEEARRTPFEIEDAETASTEENRSETTGS